MSLKPGLDPIRARSYTTFLRGDMPFEGVRFTFCPLARLAKEVTGDDFSHPGRVWFKGGVKGPWFSLRFQYEGIHDMANMLANLFTSGTVYPIVIIQQEHDGVPKVRGLIDRPGAGPTWVNECTPLDHPDLDDGECAPALGPLRDQIRAILKERERVKTAAQEETKAPEPTIQGRLPPGWVVALSPQDYCPNVGDYYVTTEVPTVVRRARESATVLNGEVRVPYTRVDASGIQGVSIGPVEGGRFVAVTPTVDLPDGFIVKHVVVGGEDGYQVRAAVSKGEYLMMSLWEAPKGPVDYANDYHIYCDSGTSVRGRVAVPYFILERSAPEPAETSDPPIIWELRTFGSLDEGETFYWTEARKEAWAKDQSNATHLERQIQVPVFLSVKVWAVKKNFTLADVDAMEPGVQFTIDGVAGTWRRGQTLDDGGFLMCPAGQKFGLKVQPPAIIRKQPISVFPR